MRFSNYNKKVLVMSLTKITRYWKLTFNSTFFYCGNADLLLMISNQDFILFPVLTKLSVAIFLN